MEGIQKVIGDVNSPVYNSTNWKQIKEYLKLKGVDVKKEVIKKFLGRERIDSVKFKNEGSQKISAWSKPFVMRSRFFSILHSDTFYLSAKRKYGARSRYILLVLDQLSRFVFLENPSSLKFADQRAAWERIFARLKNVYPEATVSTVVSDNGPEYALKLKAWLKGMNIKLNNVKLRPYRFSRGSGYAESCIRRLRANLEKEMIKKSKSQSFSDVLKRVELVSNVQWLSTMQMSATSALEHKPDYIAMKSASVKLRRKKYLGDKKEKELAIFSIVRIKKFLEKEFTSVRKESYGFLSPCFIVLAIARDRPIVSYKLANIFTLLVLPGTYRKQELSGSDLSYVEACELEEKSMLQVIKVRGDLVEYSIQASDRVFIAQRGIMNN